MISEKCSAPSGLPGPAAVGHGASKLASWRGEPLLPPPAAQEIPHSPKAALEGRGAGRSGARQGLQRLAKDLPRGQSSSPNPVTTSRAAETTLRNESSDSRHRFCALEEPGGSLAGRGQGIGWLRPGRGQGRSSYRRGSRRVTYGCKGRSLEERQVSGIT